MSTSIEYECDVEELKNSEACDDEPLNLPTKDLKGVVGVTCNVPGQNKRTRQEKQHYLMMIGCGVRILAG